MLAKIIYLLIITLTSSGSDSPHSSMQSPSEQALSEFSLQHLLIYTKEAMIS